MTKFGDVANWGRASFRPQEYILNRLDENPLEYSCFVRQLDSTFSGEDLSVEI